MRASWPAFLGVFLASWVAASDLQSALELAAKGAFGEPAMVEVEGYDRSEPVSFRLFSSGVGIAFGKRQFTSDGQTVAKVFAALAKGGFSQMPAVFGGKPKPTNKPEVRSWVAVRLGGFEKTVAQMRDGEQSKEFAQLVKKLFDLVRPQMAKGVTVGSFAEGLAALGEGKLALETLSVEATFEDQPKKFAVFSLDGLYYSWAPGNGEVKKGWVPKERVAELLKILASLDPGPRPVRFPWPSHASVSASVLSRSWGATGMPWAGDTPPEAKEFAARWEGVREQLRVWIKETVRAQE
ncbi:MAG: hypothetical protein ACP5NF_01460 [Thermoanaerobaculum sp.]